MADSPRRLAGDDNGPPDAMPRGLRSPPAVLLVLWLAAMVWFHLIQTADPGTTNIATMVATAVAVIGTIVWWIRSSGAQGRKRFFPLLLLMAGLVIFSALFEIRFSGDMGLNPRFRWARPNLPALPEDHAAARRFTKDEIAAIGRALDFPQFLGPNRDGNIPDVRLATDWKNQPPKQLWKHPIGKGWSGFATAGGSAVTLEQRPEGEMTVCYSLISGTIRWAQPSRSSSNISFSELYGGDGPRSTPAIDAGNVYTLGATGRLNCFDLLSGKRRWTRDILQDGDAENVYWGKSCSPLVVDDKVIVSAGGTGGKSLLAYHKTTGKRIWSGGDRISSYASPSLATLGGVRQVLMVNQDYLTSHDVLSGRVLWEFSWPGKSDSSANVSQAVALSADRVFLSKGYGGGSLLLKISRDSKGNWARPKVLWRSRRVMKTKFSNVVIRGGYVYGLDERILQCIDLETGKQQWKESAGRFGYGQILLAGDVIVVTTETKGDVVLIQATPEAFRRLARFPVIEGQTWNPPALAGPYLLVRNAQWAACYELPLQSD